MGAGLHATRRTSPPINKVSTRLFSRAERREYAGSQVQGTAWRHGTRVAATLHMTRNMLYMGRFINETEWPC